MSKLIDRTGQRFGMLVAIRIVGRRYGGPIWECQCDCGGTSTVKATRLKHTKSCGCTNSLDLSGQRFVNLVAIKIVGRKFTNNLWECRCDCGEFFTATAKYLKNGTSKSCGCRPTHKDLSGQSFGRLTAIRVASRKIVGRHSKIIWECQCDCGETKLVETSQLKGGGTKSCGCIRSKVVSGQKFGRLLTIESNKDKGYTEWECQCDCGTKTSTRMSSLLDGSTKSCGCLARELSSSRMQSTLKGMASNRITKTCLNPRCLGQFPGRPYQKYCSKKCNIQVRQELRECRICGKPINANETSMNKVYCSRDCSLVGQYRRDYAKRQGSPIAQMFAIYSRIDDLVITEQEIAEDE